MIQKLIGNTLYVLKKDAYKITRDLTDASIIYVNCNTIDDFKKLNPELDLVPFNYLLLRKYDPEYYQYVDMRDDAEFYFEQGIQNVSSYIDQNYTGVRQDVIYPFDLDVSVVYYFDNVLMDSPTYELTDAGEYKISAEIKDSNLYDDELQEYIIIYEKVKRTASLSFNTAYYEVSTYKDENYTGTLQQVNGVPAGQTVNYYIGNSLLSSDSITLTEPGFYVVSARLENSSIYNDTSTSYTISYQKQKRTANLSFANAVVDVSTFVDVDYSGTIQSVQNAPANVTIHYYLDDVELQGNSITLSTAGQHTVKAAIVSDEVYNDTFTTYTINYVKNKRNAVLSFANAVVEETVEDVTEYSGNVQAVSGAPQNVSINYYLGNTLLNNGVISIDNLEEGENTYTITAKIENDPVYNNAQASYTLSITMETSSYENKYFTVEALEPTTYVFDVQGTGSVSYSTDNGNTWVNCPDNTSIGEFAAGSKVLFKGNIRPTSSIQAGSFKGSARHNVYGNIKSLFFGDDFKTAGGLNNNYLLTNFFSENTKLVSAEDLVMPSDFGGQRTCDSMFYRCTSLVSAPKILPAMTLTNQCYTNMFRLCSSLVNAPQLPATTLAQSCYKYMFQGCSSLVNAPELPATTLPSQCYQYMFGSCTKLNYIKAACPPNTETDKNYWVQNVSATGTYIISDPNYNINDGVRFSIHSIPNGWIIKDYQGNTINPKQIVYFANPNNQNLTVEIGEQRTLNYQIVTDPVAALSEVVYSYSTDNINWTNTIPQYLDTTTDGTFTYYIKAEILNSSNYINKSQTIPYTYGVRDYGQISDYIRLDQIENLDSLLGSDTLNFHYIIFDKSITQTNTSNIIDLKNLRTGRTEPYNKIQTRSDGQQITFNGSTYNITSVGVPVPGHTDFYYYYFSDLMQIYALWPNVFKNMVYFRLPNYTPPKQNVTLSFTNSVVNVSTYIDQNYNGTIQEVNGVPSDVSVNYYLDDVLLSSDFISLTTKGNHVVKAKIENSSKYNDAEASYTINYTKNKYNIRFNITFTRGNQTVNNEEFNIGQYVQKPQVNVTNNGSASWDVYPTITYSDDGVNYYSDLSSHPALNTTGAGNYKFYVKVVLSGDMHYNNNTTIGEYNYTVVDPNQDSSEINVDDYSFSYTANFEYYDSTDGYEKPIYYSLLGTQTSDYSEYLPYPTAVNIYVDDVLYQQPTFGADVDLADSERQLLPIIEITPENAGEHTIKFVLKSQTNAAQTLHNFINTYFINCHPDGHQDIGTYNDFEVSEDENWRFEISATKGPMTQLYFCAQYPTATYGTDFESFLNSIDGSHPDYIGSIFFDSVEEVYIDSDNAAYHNDEVDGIPFIKRTSDDEQVYPYVELEDSSTEDSSI